jgi:hypothetical protein
MRGISRLAKNLLASEEGLYSMELDVVSVAKMTVSLKGLHI